MRTFKYVCFEIASSIDVPRPLSNDLLWVFLLQNIDAERKKMSQSGWNICVCQIFYCKYKLMHETLFSRTVYHIVNKVLLQCLLLIYS